MLLVAVAAGCGHGSVDAWEAFAVGVPQPACGSRGACSLTVHDAPHDARAGSGKVAVLQLSGQLPWSVHGDANGLAADAWAERLGASFVINAGFYGRDGQHRGWLKAAQGWHQPHQHATWQGLVVSQPAGASNAVTRLVDLQREGAAAAAEYGHVAQTMMLLDHTGQLRCSASGRAAARTAVASDGDGTLYVVVTKGAWTLPGLAAWLQRTLPKLTCAVNLDGGPEAQLALRRDEVTYVFFADHGSLASSVFARRGLPYVWALAEADAEALALAGVTDPAAGPP